MKKKLLVLLMALVCAFACAFAFASCDDGKDGTGGDGQNNEQTGGNEGTGGDEGTDGNEGTGGNGGSGEQKAEVAYTLSEDGNSYVVTKGTFTSGELEILDKYEGKSVTAIADNAFKDCSALTKVTLPSTVTQIGEYAFMGTAIKSVNLKYVRTVGKGAFKNCTSLEFFTYGPYLENISDEMFYGCTSLMNRIAFDNFGSAMAKPKIASIGVSAFENCTALSGGFAPEGLTAIKEAAFRGSGITSITIRQTVTSIGAQAFKNCAKLTSVDFQLTGGWKAGETDVAEQISMESIAAQYLTTTYADVAWTKS